MALPLLGAWLWVNAALHLDRSYVEQFGNPPAVMLSHFSYYGKELRDLWRNGFSGIIMRVVFLTINGLAIWGYVADLRRGVSTLAIFLVLYVATILSWPHYQGIRYLFPVLPLYLFYALAGLEEAARRWFPSAGSLPLKVFLVAVAVTYATRYPSRTFGPLHEGIGTTETQAVFTYLRQQTAPDAVVVCAKPRAIALFTGRRAAVYHSTEGDEGLLRYFGRIGADYALVNPIFFSDHEFFGPFIARHSTYFTEIFSNGTFHVYHIHDLP
jgi:hypothetical protein